MRRLAVRTADGAVVAPRVLAAERWWQRLVGLLGRTRLEPGEGMLLVPCGAVHMLGMRMPLDVALLDRTGAVLAVFEALAPGPRVARHRGAWAALEVPAGTMRRAGITPGARLTWEATA